MTGQLILAVRARNLPEQWNASGFHRLGSDDIVSTLSSAGLWLGPRNELEIDDSFRQLIPYIVLLRGSELVCYRRASSGGERRLHGRLSIGLGGHVDVPDLVVDGEQIALEATLLAAAQREVMEEIGNVNVLARRWVGLLVDDTTAVGRVHLGVVGIWSIADAVECAAEDALCEVRQISIGNLMRAASELETWSAMLAATMHTLVAI